MLQFIRADLSRLKAYQPHPGGEIAQPLDRLDTNESPWDLPSDLKEKLTWIYHHHLEANRYPDGSHWEIKEALRDYVNESGNLKGEIQPENLSFGNGSDELIRSLLIATCLGGEGAILVADPTFSMYGILAQTLGIAVERIERSPQNFTLNLSQAQQKIENTQNPPIRVVFVVHPNSPTGNALTEEELDWLRRLPPNILVVIDEAYFEFSQTSVIEELSQHPNWVILRTFSKAFRLATHRVGYAIANPELIQVLEKVRLPYNLPSFSQAAVQVVLQNRQLILSSVSQILAERETLFQALSQNPALQVFPSAANFIYLRLKSGEQEQLEKICQNLKRKGTLIRHTGGGLRITIGTPEENQRTLEHLNSQL